MNDFIAGRLADERTKDYLREVERDRPAELLRASLPSPGESATPAPSRRPGGHTARVLLQHLWPHGHRPTLTHHA